VVSGAIDTAHHWSAMSLTLLTAQMSDFKVEYLGKFEKGFTHIKLFDDGT
jgi:hypothetical protein